MTTRSKRKPNAPSKQDENSDMPDDNSEVTAPTGIEKNKIDNQMVTKVLKFSFVTNPKQQTKPAHPSAIHTHWMHALQTALGEEVTIWNNKGEKVAPLNLIQWTSNPTIHQKQFTVHQKITGGHSPRRNIRYFIVHRIITSESISTIKNIPAIHQILRDNSCFLHEHSWNEDEWDTTKIGFVTKLDPNFYNPEQAYTKFTSYLKEQIKQLQGRTKIKIPKFRMVFSSPKIRNDKNQTISTKAYAVEVKHEDAMLMLQTLKSLLRDTPVFVPFSMRNKFPDGFAKAIKYQTQMLTSTMVIVLQYLHPDMMFHIDELIKAINGVIDIMPDKNVLITGKYRVQVSEDKFKTARDLLIRFLPAWCEEHIPVDAYPNPNPFPETPKVQPIHNDGFSSGENSWMSMSNASFLSMDLTNVADDDYFSSTTIANKTFTYAGIVLTSNTAEPLIPRKSYPTATYPSDDDTKAAISEITTTVKTDSIYAHQQQELELAKQIIENQRQEIEKLKEEQDKSNEKYSNIVAMMNDRLQEQDSETATLKKEISTMILQQQNNHTQEMQDLYERMMRQMANMLSPLSQPESTYQTQDSTPEKDTTTLISSTAPKPNDLLEQQYKKQDTRPSPTKRKPIAPATSATTYTPPAVQHTSNHPPMEIECESPTIEDDV
jgi:hypothetical protein